MQSHDFFWFFSGPEPFWPESKYYETVTDPADPRFREPDTTISEYVRQLVDATVSGDGKTVTYDTTYELAYDTAIVYPAFDSSYTLYADLNENGRWDKSPISIDHNGNGLYDGPASGDFEWWRWEMRDFWQGERFDFSTNDFAVVIAKSAVTEEGVAYARLTYPRQVARRLYVTVNAEANGIRDRDGERILLPVVR
jgi:hypothetical protein